MKNEYEKREYGSFKRILLCYRSVKQPQEVKQEDAGVKQSLLPSDTHNNEFILCSAGRIIGPVLNNHVRVESLNALVALNKAGMRVKPARPDNSPRPPPPRFQAQTKRITPDCLIKADKLRCQSPSLAGAECLRCVSAH